MDPLRTALVILLTPLLSATVIALFLRRRGAAASWVSVGAAGVIALLSLQLVSSRVSTGVSVEWLRFGDFAVTLGFKIDPLALLMLFVVGVVGFLIHLFSLGYMHDDPARGRYFAGLSVFMFSMLGIVLADSLFMLFVFWELVGFSSYLLIGHYHEKQSAADAAKKAFIVNRIGDFGFLLGIIWCYWAFGTTNLDAIATSVHGGHLIVNAGIPLLLFCGALGKSAQMPLHVWLPDAMEGPTPVSALIHAATMVAAGIYMLCRVNVLMVPEALNVIAAVGTVTAVYAALCAVVQSDIKRVLAYSTLSQLGYMVAAFGLGSLVYRHEMGGRTHELVLAAGVGAAMFHLTTHAFFKALLFLGSGSVILGCHHEQDIFKMGGLMKKMPFTGAMFGVGVLAIVGFPFLAGFFSKDAILYLAYENNKLIFAALAGTAVLTSFYMLRLWKLVFWGTPRSEAAEHAHEGSWTMRLALLVLAILSLIGGWPWVFSKIAGEMAALVPEAEGSAHTLIFAVSLAVMALGAGAAWLFYPAQATDALEEKAGLLYRGLQTLKNSFDDIYGYYVAKIQQRFAMLLNFLDQIFLAGFVVRGFSGLVGILGIGARALHVGSLHVYVYWFLLGVALLWGYATGLLS
ncbi:MAG: NADH-quinone oxidoreductase subunit L [Opitutales bacterium]